MNKIHVEGKFFSYFLMIIVNFEMSYPSKRLEIKLNWYNFSHIKQKQIKNIWRLL